MNANCLSVAFFGPNSPGRDSGLGLDVPQRAVVLGWGATDHDHW